MTDVDPLQPLPWALEGGPNNDPVGDVKRWATAAGRELTATRIQLKRLRNCSKRELGK
jgi:hypothetical protein